jgi:transcriptional regulator with XRE-family HTH domain
MNTHTLSEMTAAVLESYGWTQAALAQRVGVTVATISRLAAGKHASASWEVGSQIAALFAARPPVPTPRIERRGRPRKVIAA